MEKSDEQSGEKVLLNKARSHLVNCSVKSNNESVQRKSFDVNEAVKSLDLALGRLKKSKLVNGEAGSVCGAAGGARVSPDLFMDARSSYSSNDNASLMSMNFSHYELMRNLSFTNCTSDAGHSGTTCSCENPSDITLKNEHLEKYFRSAEMWSRMSQERSTSAAQLQWPK